MLILEDRDCYNVFDGNWYNFNDSQVTQQGSVKESSSYAYVLFYVKQNELAEIEERIRRP